MTGVRQRPVVEGVLETALYVDDLASASAFYEDVIGLRPIFGDSRLAAFDAGRHGVLLLFLRGSTLETVHMPGGSIPPHDGRGPLHLAFAIATDALPAWEAHLAAKDVPIESRTRWPRGQSLYFRDPAGHLVELATPGLWPTR